MAVNFVLRSPYLPSNRLVLRLQPEAKTPLEWFQAIWPQLLDGAATEDGLLEGQSLYGFAGFTERVREQGLPSPKTCEELAALLSTHWYSNNVESREGYLLIETDDDEVELAYWWLSDDVLSAEAASFAIYATDPLPDGAGSEGFEPQTDVEAMATADGAGTVYGVFSTTWDSCNLGDLPGPIRIDGLRLPELSEWLRRFEGDPEHPLEIDWLALVARANPDSDLTNLLRRIAKVSVDAASEHFAEIHAGSITEETLQCESRGARSPKQEPVVQAGEHHAELRFDDGFSHHVWVFFDDLWASAHPDLANSLLRFATPIEEWE